MMVRTKAFTLLLAALALVAALPVAALGASGDVQAAFTEAAVPETEPFELGPDGAEQELAALTGDGGEPILKAGELPNDGDEFEIDENGVLVKYNGEGGDVVIVVILSAAKDLYAA